MVSISKFKPIARHDLFNLIQDLRHLIILDVRPQSDYDKGHVRDSLNFPEENKDYFWLTKVVNEISENYSAQEKKYSTKKIRRLVIIANDNSEQGTKNIEKFLEGKEVTFDKLLILSKGFDFFLEKYPFLCLTKEMKEFAHSKLQKDFRPSKEQPLSPFEDRILYAFSRFPTEIVEGTLFIGDIFNSLSKRQLNDLKIKSLIDFTNYEGKEETIPEFKKALNFKNIPIEESLDLPIDFDEINSYIEELITSSRVPILLYCKTGDSVAPAFAISYLMMKKNMKFDIASLVVFQKRSCVNILKWLYSQIMVFQPGKMKKI